MILRTEITFFRLNHGPFFIVFLSHHPFWDQKSREREMPASQVEKRAKMKFVGLFEKLRWRIEQFDPIWLGIKLKCGKMV